MHLSGIRLLNGHCDKSVLIAAIATWQAKMGRMYLEIYQLLHHFPTGMGEELIMMKMQELC